MQAEQLLREKKLDDAHQALKDEVRAEPQDAKKRIFLFQLLCVLGDWERAATQLDVAAELDSASNKWMAQLCHQALQCEAMRTEVLAGRRTPLIFGEPAEWVSWLVQASQMVAEGQYGPAEALRDQALEAAPATAGTIDETPFEWLADADVRLGPLLEAYIEGRYYWVPLTCIQRLDIEAPSDLRDFVWLPVQFTWTNGGETVALIPTRYPGSEASDDPVLRLAHGTDWRQPAETTWLGLGQRMLMTDQDYYPIGQVRELVFDQPAEAAPAAQEAANG